MPAFAGMTKIPKNELEKVYSTAIAILPFSQKIAP
jgi:hypothetical protein